jgi:ADP-ribosylglycohydrolase
MSGATHHDRLSRARQSLAGLSCGDAFGERFFLPDEVALPLINRRALPAPPWFFTDDTLMALSIVAILEEHGKIDQDHLAMSFAVNHDPSRGYGAAMHKLLPKIRHGGCSWRDESKKLFGGTGSFGNGSAMRVAPLGAFFADDLELASREAELSAVTTHAHPEAVAGAIAVAVAAGLAWRFRQAGRPPESTEFLENVYQRTPESEVRLRIRRAMNLPAKASVSRAASVLGTGVRVTAQDTVPFALWTAARHLDNYEEAMWTTLSGMGDRDTTCAITGGIVVMYAGTESIPQEWLDCREQLPNWILKPED